MEKEGNVIGVIWYLNLRMVPHLEDCWISACLEHLELCLDYVAALNHFRDLLCLFD